MRDLRHAGFRGDLSEQGEQRVVGDGLPADVVGADGAAGDTEARQPPALGTDERGDADEVVGRADVDRRGPRRQEHAAHGVVGDEAHGVGDGVGPEELGAWLPGGRVDAAVGVRAGAVRDGERSAGPTRALDAERPGTTAGHGGDDRARVVGGALRLLRCRQRADQRDARGLARGPQGLHGRDAGQRPQPHRDGLAVALGGGRRGRRAGCGGRRGHLLSL